jgi:DNA-binding MarR family transcriptional regulator
MKKLTNTQLKILSQAAQQENGAAFVPERTGTVAIRKLSDSLVERKLMREIRTKPGMPIWQKAEDGRSISLVILKAGRELILEHGGALSSDKRVLLVNPSEDEPKGPLPPTTSLAQPRAGSKLALVIAMLSNEAGASLKALAEMAGWLPHTTRATLTALRKRGFLIERVKHHELGSVYRIAGGSKMPVTA